MRDLLHTLSASRPWLAGLALLLGYLLLTATILNLMLGCTSAKDKQDQPWRIPLTGQEVYVLAVVTAMLFVIK